MKNGSKKLLACLRGNDRGTVAITFLLSLPILLFIIGIFTQYALLVNARIGIDRAAMAAARSAVTSFPTDPVVDNMDGIANVERACYMALEPLSPQATDGVSPDAQDVASALQNVGASVPQSYAARYSYAQEATTFEVNGQPIADVNCLNYAQSTGQQITLTVHYKFYLTVPGARSIPNFGQVDTVGGINGRFLTLTSSYVVQLTHGREAGAGNGP